MAKVFRLYNIQGNNNIVDWQESKVYGSQAISEITDPDGADAKKEITSIPSPFARIDLIKTAFKEVVDLAKKTPNFDRLLKSQLEPIINGKTIYHRMVSEALDVAEIFFNYDRFKDKFEIIVWDKNKDLDKYNVFGKTLDRYLKSDATGDDPYNFGKLERIYMLNYIGPDRPSTLNIIGATSPATLFFSSANDLSYVTKNVAIGLDRPFDTDYTALFKRDFEFQKYLFAFRKAYSGFQRDFPELHNYLEINYRCLSDAQKGEIDALTDKSINEYETIAVGEKGENTFEILGRPFHKKPNKTNWKSDFEIKSDLYTGAKKPLVLPVEKGNTYENLKFTTDKWGKQSKAEYYDSTPWINRRLPIVSDQYPYLTISDFLQDYIVRMPYEIDKNNFFDGNISKADGNSYLLPLKDLFFTFFTVKDLQGTVEGKKMFEFVANAGGIKVILRIPVQAGCYIEYSRAYFETSSPDIEHNDGALLEDKFGLGIMPLIKFPESVNKHYRIAMFDKGKTDAVLTCVKGNDYIETKKVTRAKKDLAGRGCSHESYVVEDNFDRIQVKVGDITGFLVPKFIENRDSQTGKIQSGSAVFTFAVDFGTTNTHIEYCEGTNTRGSKPFDMDKSDYQLRKLHSLYTDPDIRLGFEQEFVPETVGEKQIHSLPMRTVFSHHKDIKPTQNPIPLADGNIPFLYEKDFTPNWNDIKTEELKWGGVLFEKLSEMYLETLFILMRNKVAYNNGNLEATKIIWFYPASMTEHKVNGFKRIWKSAYEKYFGKETNNVICISESKAPYTYYIVIENADPECVTIDVGGGTTDVFVVEREEPKMLLSFRFASNAIFGDGYNSNPSKNGFVRMFKKNFEAILNDNGLQALSQALNQIESQNKSSDIIAFLFSLTGDKVENNPDLNFLHQLMKNDKMRYVFIVFYAAILYFIAKSMKAKGLMKPKTLGFSGNGSNSFRIVSDEQDMQQKFVKLIFDTVYNDKSGSVEVIVKKNPKIATCKGGIVSKELQDLKSQDYNEIDEIKSIILGDNFDNISAKKLTYKDVNQEVENNVVKSVEDFFNFLFDLHTNNNDFLCNKLGADPEIFSNVKEFLQGEEGKQLLSTSMFKGLKKKREDDKITDETKVEETLFFYPLIGVLHDLALKISEM
ncbi:MAG: hypothetical protein LBR17_07870 [Bacteroidales bacterium]|jgi:hypothetical protein|nr:hypothetical protein [Bacteroidales bacterium]